MPHESRIVLGVLLAVLAAGRAAGAADGGAVGARPYEMVWAERTSDTRPPLVDFETLEGWTVDCRDAQAGWSRSREEQLWGQSVGKLVYRGTGPRPRMTIRPPQAIAAPGAFNCVNLWVYGNNWAWAPDRTTPQVEIAVLLADAAGRELRVPLGRVRWKEWWLMHARLGDEEAASLDKGATLCGIEISGGRNEDDRKLYFDNLALYQETLPPLQFQPRPKRGIEPFAGQTTGTNTGPGTLPFPTRPETILPDNLTNDFKVDLESSGGQYVFRYQGDDGKLVYRYRPDSGTLGDVTAEWPGRGEPLRPMAGGGLYFVSDAGPEPVAPENAELLDCRRQDDTVVSRWRYGWGKYTAEATYTLRLWQKSLVIDVKCLGGTAGEFRVGAAVGMANPRLVTIPYLTGAKQRPAVVVAGPAERPLFMTALVDHCRSNASELWAANEVTPEGVLYNGGSRYLPKTDGRRNDCFERLFLTVSPRFEEVLPNVPNPRSPWMHVAGERVWRAHGASNRDRDYATWKEVARYGMTKVVITDHETGWRDGGESFTLRTRAAPGKGGDAGQADYARKIHALGFRYGIYNNYTDFAPVNEHWSEDYVTRLSDGSWQPAWARCYNLKPSRAVELEARLAPIIQQKFHLDTAYCDVHTAVRPWQYCDFDARVPGAGTFAATFYAYGEIMLHQKATWNGPVYSEGNNHWYYCGLTDGNYGQDQLARLDENPWLVDFDLRKLHPLCSNFGMGNPGMFFGRKERLGSTPDEREARLDRFLAATLAFGHTGFLVMEGGMQNAVRSYFNLQQVHAAYARATVREIRYADEHGRLVDPSTAVAGGAFRRSQIATTYSNGVKVLVNGHASETWKTPRAELPPNGWYAEDGRDHTFVAFSALVDGHRADYVDSPAYVYADGRGRFTRFDKAACDGQMIAHKRADGSLEVIPVGGCKSFGVSLDGRTASATALDREGAAIGPAKTRLARGLVYVTPLEGVFSYVLTPGPAPDVSLKCDRRTVVPGETVTVVGHAPRAYHVPADTPPATHLWAEFEGAWIDFAVAPMVDAELSLSDQYRLTLASNLPAPADAEVNLAGQMQSTRLVPGEAVRLSFALARPSQEEVRAIELRVRAGQIAFRRTWWLKAEETPVAVGELPEAFEASQCLRGEAEKPLATDGGAQATRRETTCGGVARPSLFMHPPYKKGVGYTSAVFGPIPLPAAPAAVFRARIGKGDGSDPGDGILFRLGVVDSAGRETVVAEKQWIRHAWTLLVADLAPWAGQAVRLKLMADVGPGDNSSGDWAAWSDTQLESASPVLKCSLFDQPQELRREAGPYPLAGVTPAQLRAARKGTLHFQAIGLQQGGSYTSYGLLNDVPLGPLPAAGGNERKGTWSDGALPLSAEAIAALTVWNGFRIRNPGGDCFKIRRVWIELDLTDGRRCSSMVTNAVTTQPPDWLYAEGTGVPRDEEIRLEVAFPAPGP